MMHFKKKQFPPKPLFRAALFMIAGVMFFTSCSDKAKESSSRQQAKAPKKEEPSYQKVTSMQITESRDIYTVGDVVSFRLNWPDTIAVDSIHSYANRQLKNTFMAPQKIIEVATGDLPVGNNTFKITLFLNNGHKERHYQSLRFKSDIEPEQLKCKIEKTYPHDPDAFTQGLFYENGFLYEGTGKRGASSLRKINLENGELISSLALPNQYFGEGITAFKDRIIQLTWTSKTGFIYDKETFSLINKVRYPTQGWGLTSDSSELIMSDGTATIYFLNANFNEIKRIHIYNDQGAVNNLNELEYIHGKVYANVYQQNYIISFDPATGKVLERIDCSMLVPDRYQNSRENVLNGIAYIPEEDRLLLTGKRWGKIYKVKVVKK